MSTAADPDPNNLQTPEGEGQEDTEKKMEQELKEITEDGAHAALKKLNRLLKGSCQLTETSDLVRARRALIRPSLIVFAGFNIFGEERFPRIPRVDKWLSILESRPHYISTPVKLDLDIFREPPMNQVSPDTSEDEGETQTGLVSTSEAANKEPEGDDEDGEGDIEEEGDILETISFTEQAEEGKGKTAVHKREEEEEDDEEDDEEEEEDDDEEEEDDDEEEEDDEDEEMEDDEDEEEEESAAKKRRTGGEATTSDRLGNEGGSGMKKKRKPRTNLLLFDLPQYETPCRRCYKRVYVTDQGTFHQPCYIHPDEAKKVCFLCARRKQGCRRVAKEGDKPAEGANTEGEVKRGVVGKGVGRGTAEMKGKAQSVVPAEEEKSRVRGKAATRKVEEMKGDMPTKSTGKLAEKATDPVNGKTERASAVGKGKTRRSTEKPIDEEDEAMKVDDKGEKVTAARKGGKGEVGQNSGKQDVGGRSRPPARGTKRKAKETDMDVDEEVATRGGERRSQSLTTNAHQRTTRPIPSRRVSPANPTEYPQGDIYRQVSWLVEDRRIAEGKVAEALGEVRAVQRNQDQDRQAIHQRVNDIEVNQKLAQTEDRKRMDELESRVGKLEGKGVDTIEEGRTDNTGSTAGTLTSNEGTISTESGGNGEEVGLQRFLDQMEAGIKSAVSESHGEGMRHLQSELGQRFDSLAQSFMQQVQLRDRYQALQFQRLEDRLSFLEQVLTTGPGNEGIGRPTQSHGYSVTPGASDMGAFRSPSAPTFPVGERYGGEATFGQSNARMPQQPFPEAPLIRPLPGYP
ncbi:hypothetical protein NMY22_g19289 [Coprinellus aureogranulatus]|nr:hypothetical protein NMY22_g19289 [Coprinellus aureogranulatus]